MFAAWTSMGILVFKGYFLIKLLLLTRTVIKMHGSLFWVTMSLIIKPHLSLRLSIKSTWSEFQKLPFNALLTSNKCNLDSNTWDATAQRQRLLHREPRDRTLWGIKMLKGIPSGNSGQNQLLPTHNSHYAASTLITTPFQEFAVGDWHFPHCFAERGHVHRQECGAGLPSFWTHTREYHGNSGTLSKNMAASTWSMIQLRNLPSDVEVSTYTLDLCFLDTLVNNQITMQTTKVYIFVTVS